MVYAFFILLVLISIIILMDVVPQFTVWYGRIGIGRFRDDQVWKKKVAHITKKWLYNTPVAKITDNTRLIFLDILKRSYSSKSIQSWQKGALLLGLAECGYYAEPQKFIKASFSSEGNWKTKPSEIDDALFAFAVMRADPSKITEHKPAYDFLYHLIKSKIGEDETVAYRDHMKDYRYVDTVGFISPFLMQYGLSFGNQEAVDLSIRQISEYVKRGISQQNFLPAHTYQISNKYTAGLTGWGRGFAWFIIGVTDTFKILPQQHPSKTEFRNLIKKLFCSAKNYQDINGGFHWILQDKTSNFDSSVTAVLAWFFGECEQFEELKPEAKSLSVKSLNYLKSVTRKSGAVDFSQGDTKAIGVYSQNFEILPFTQGFCLRALSKMK